MDPQQQNAIFETRSLRRDPQQQNAIDTHCVLGKPRTKSIDKSAQGALGYARADDNQCFGLLLWAFDTKGIFEPIKQHHASRRYFWPALVLCRAFSLLLGQNIILK